MSYCNWDKTSKLNTKYHDKEWGVPVHSDYKQFEFLLMEVFQCGLSWDLMINKREIFRKCFDNFDYKKIAKYGKKDIERILKTEGMIRSKQKIEAVINNAIHFLEIRKEFGTFSKYLWSYTNGFTILYNKHNDGFIPVSNGLSQKISDDLKKRGFRYLGPIVIYSHMQGAGLINDHDKNCPRYKYLINKYKTVKMKRDREVNVNSF